MSAAWDAVVIGGGVVGLAVAFHLSQRGWRTLVLEKEYPGSGSTLRCIGGIRQQFSSEASIRLMQESVRQFRQMEAVFGFPVEYHEGGYLFLAHDPQRLEMFRAILPLQLRLGLNVRLLSASECLDIVPPLSIENLVGGAYSPDDGQAYPFKVVQGYIQEIRRANSQVRPFTAVSEIVVANGVVQGVKTQGGDAIATPNVVIACGPWARELGELAGLELPIFAEEHEAVITSRTLRLVDTMVVDYRADGCYFYQRCNGQIIGCYTPAPNKPGICTDSSLDFLLEMPRRMLRLIPAFAHARIIRHWGGCYEMTPDGNPIIDRTSITGLYVSAGMCGHGFMFAPAVGKFLSQIMVDGTYPFDWSDFSSERDFSRTELMK